MSGSVDLSRIKPGDEVAIRAYVETLGPSLVCVRWTASECGGKPSNFTNDAIVSHTPKPFAAGDQVKPRGWQSTVCILCIHGQWAWLADSEDTTIQLPLSALERA